MTVLARSKALRCNVHTGKQDWIFADHDAYMQNSTGERIWRNPASDRQQNHSAMFGRVKKSGWTGSPNGGLAGLVLGNRGPSYLLCI